MALTITELRDATLAAVAEERTPADEQATVVELATASIVKIDDATTTCVESLLLTLRSANDEAAEREVLRGVPQATRGLSPIDRAYFREEIIAILSEHGRSSPARIADAALGVSWVAPALKPTIIRQIEPWSEPVDGLAVINELSQTFSRYLALPPGAADALALWTLHTYVYERFPITPRLLIQSPEKRCGKSTLLYLLEPLVSRAVNSANLTAAVMFRLIDSEAPTLLVDEADTFLEEARELRGVINAGHMYGGVVLRCDGEKFEPRSFSCFSPLALAAIGKVPDTITDRSIAIRMRRREQGEHVERLRRDKPEPLRDLASRCRRWADDHGDRLHLDPALPDDLHDRARDNWRVLIAIADWIGGEWPNRARNSASTLSPIADDEESSRVMLLTDIREIFQNADVSWLPTRDLLAELNQMEDRPWGEWSHARPMTAHALGMILRPFGISSEQRRNREVRHRGYHAVDFTDAWSRYTSTPSTT